MDDVYGAPLYFTPSGTYLQPEYKNTDGAIFYMQQLTSSPFPSQNFHTQADEQSHVSFV